jgi:hypothetical protein
MIPSTERDMKLPLELAATVAVKSLAIGAAGVT